MPPQASQRPDVQTNMHDMARKLQRNKENGTSLAMGASKDSLYTIQDGGAPSHRIAASSGQVGAGACRWLGWVGGGLAGGAGLAGWWLCCLRISRPYV